MKNFRMGFWGGIVGALVFTISTALAVNVITDFTSGGIVPEVAKMLANPDVATFQTGTMTVTGVSTQTGAMGFGSTFIGTGTSSIGWSVQSSANQACNTTCVTPCVVGINSAILVADVVDCADATADKCVCAGAS